MINTFESGMRLFPLSTFALSFWAALTLASPSAHAGESRIPHATGDRWQMAQGEIAPDPAKPDAADAPEDAQPEDTKPDEAQPDEAQPDADAPDEAVPDEAAPADSSGEEEDGDGDDHGGGVELPRDADGHVSIPGVPEYKAPEVLHDLSLLPFPARRMRELLIEAAKSGDIEKLRPLIGTGDSATQLALGGIDGDPIEYLKSLSGDQQGYEILAMLEEVLEAGFVRIDAGSEAELYVWPYFFTTPLAKLTPAQRVELYRLVTHGDYEDMKAFGAYNFYRTAITPQGKWQFFVAGD